MGLVALAAPAVAPSDAASAAGAADRWNRQTGTVTKAQFDDPTI